MKRLWTDTEIQKKLKSMVVLVDTREQVWGHIEKSLNSKGVEHKRITIESGDYSCALPHETGMISLTDEIVIERKASLDEIAGNFTRGRDAFEREFLRAKAMGTKVILLIENASWKDVFCHNYKSKLSPKALEGGLLSWQMKYGITIMFSPAEYSGELIYTTLYYWLRGRLKLGGF